MIPQKYLFTYIDFYVKHKNIVKLKKHYQDIIIKYFKLIYYELLMNIFAVSIW